MSIRILRRWISLRIQSISMAFGFRKEENPIDMCLFRNGRLNLSI